MAVVGVVFTTGPGTVVVVVGAVDDDMRTVVDVSSAGSLASTVLPEPLSLPANARRGDAADEQQQRGGAGDREAALATLARDALRDRVERRCQSGGFGVVEIFEHLVQLSSDSPSAVRRAARPRLACDLTVPTAQPNTAAVCSSVRSAR